MPKPRTSRKFDDHQFLLACATLIALVLVIAGAAAGPQKPEPPQKPKPTPVEKKDRTTPAQQKMTERQRAHGRKHDRFKGPNTKMLDEALSVEIHVEEVGEPDPTPQSLPQIIEGLTCRSDVVFKAQIVKGQTFPTESGGFLFTDYSLVVSDVVRVLNGIGPAGVVSLSQPGGSLRVEGRLVKAKIAGYPQLQVGLSYLFFAKRVPDGGGFTSVDSHGTFVIRPGGMVPIIPLPTTDPIPSKGVAATNLDSMIVSAVCQ